eukprot:tig00020848_g14607.t1
MVNEAELADRLERIREENEQLKRANTDLESKTKRMATQLIRITADVSKRDKENAPKGAPASARGRKEIEAEALIDELRQQLAAAKKQKDKMAIKLLAAQSAKTKSSRYANVQPKVPARRQLVLRSGGGYADVGSLIHQISEGQAAPKTSRSVNDINQSHIEEHASSSNPLPTDDKLNVLVGMLRQRLVEAEGELSKLRSENTVLRARPGQIDGSEDVEYASLRQELREKGSKLNLLQSQYTQVEAAFRAVKENHEQVLVKYEELNKQLKEERRKNLQLEHDLEVARLGEGVQQDLKVIIEDLRNENRKLVDENMKFMTKQMSVPQLTEVRNKLRDYERTVQALQQQLSTQESVAKKLKDNNSALEARIQALSSENENLRKTSEEAQKLLYKEQKEREALARRIQIFSSDSGIDLVQLEKALALVGEGKISFDIEKEVDHDALAMRKEISSLRLANAELLQELEKYKHLLKLQETINKDLSGEKEHTTNQVDLVRREYEKKLEEQARLLDARSDRIRKLEIQNRDIAYRIAKAQRGRSEPSAGEPDFDPDLKEGENMVEIVLEDAMFDRNVFEDESVSTFFTWDFYEHETQATPVIPGLSPIYSFASQYVVVVDEFFLQFLSSQRMLLELHQANGLDFERIGQSEINLSDLLEAGGKKHATANVLSVSDRNVVLGTVHFSMRLRHPIASSLKVFEETRKDPFAPPAPLVTKPKRAVTPEEAGRKLPPTRSVKELEISVHGCSDLPLRADGTEPSPFVSFEFYEFDAVVTRVTRNDRSPSFKFSKTFMLQFPDTEFDKYLRSSKLLLQVFDDVHPGAQEQIASTLVPLMPLLEQRSVAGSFPLMDQHKTLIQGTIQVQISWKTPMLEAGGMIAQESPQVDPSGSSVSMSSAMPGPAKAQKSGPTSQGHSADRQEAQRIADRPPSSQPTSGGDFSRPSTAVVVRSHEEDIERAMRGVNSKETIIVGIGELILNREVLSDPSLKALYVAYEFLDAPVEDLETDIVRIEEARNGRFQFRHVQYFKVDNQNNSRQRWKLKRVLADADEEKSNILFTVVNEDEHGKCFEVGQCVLNIRDIRDDGKDAINEPLPVYDSNSDDMNEIGSLRVSCIALAAIQALG